MQQIKTGVIVFATSDCKQGQADARQWLRDKCLTPDQVRLYRDKGQVLVQTLKPINIAH